MDWARGDRIAITHQQRRLVRWRAVDLNETRTDGGARVAAAVRQPTGDEREIETDSGHHGGVARVARARNGALPATQPAPVIRTGAQHWFPALVPGTGSPHGFPA
jgi:hypothetical protein